MPQAELSDRRALVIGIGQRLAGPAETILGYQLLILDSLRPAAPPEAVADAEKVLGAAQALQEMITALLSPEGHRALAELDEATLRHELRTPMNAILGYSELLLEEWQEALDPELPDDIARVVKECRALLAGLDDLVDFSRGRLDDMAIAESDSAIAEALSRSLSPTVPGPRQLGGRILVIDDVAANCELLCRNLQRRGHEAISVSSARAALELLEEARFDLALVDILMPDMNGIELLARLKGDPRWRDMGVVMVSGLKDVQATVQCIKAGAEDYLHKPVDPVLLNARVESCLEQRRWRAQERQYLKQIEYEKSRADGLLLSMLPETIIARVGAGENVIADRFDAASIIFADIVDFTPLVAQMDPSDLVGLLHDLFSAFDRLAEQHGIEKIKTIGDAYMAVAGVPVSQQDHADRALAFAQSLIALMAEGFGAAAPLSIRVGINSGPVIAGLIGQKRFVYDVWGEPVNLACRLEASGAAGRIQISRATLDALATPPPCISTRQTEIKGIGRMTTYLIG
ncbi:adenylate/guanylate cyclase domain-containing protein [Sulfitobacter aestuarii]|uniref:histidine kinase n=1 Tax=Sulfitobacter aestuarii TaxID=2161676 RepID=A0ABW5U0U4_9RHOB